MSSAFILRGDATYCAGCGAPETARWLCCCAYVSPQERELEEATELADTICAGKCPEMTTLVTSREQTRHVVEWLIDSAQLTDDDLAQIHLKWKE